MFNVYKNHLSRQTGSRNLAGPKTLPTIWGTYMKLVTKYQISTIKLLRKMRRKISWTDGRTDGKIGKFNRLLARCCRSFFTTTVYKYLTTSCIWSCLMSYFKWSISDEATSYWTIHRLYKFSASPVKLCYVTIKLPIHFGNSSNTILLLYPRSLKGEGGILFYLCPSVLLSVQDIFRRIFLSKCWWQKSDIWSKVESYNQTVQEAVMVVIIW
jgi:hypothetical protein